MAYAGSAIYARRAIRAFFYSITTNTAAALQNAVRITAASPDHAFTRRFIRAAYARPARTRRGVINYFNRCSIGAIPSIAAVPTFADTAAVSEIAIIVLDT
jgi:hypothetical protein